MPVIPICLIIDKDIPKRFFLAPIVSIVYNKQYGCVDPNFSMPATKN